MFRDDSGSQEGCIPGCRKKPDQLVDDEPLDLFMSAPGADGTRLATADAIRLAAAAKLPGRTDYDLNIMFSGTRFSAIENPLADAIDQYVVGKRNNRPIPPEVNAGNGRDFE